MDLATAHRVLASWDRPLPRYFFWYLLIPAALTVQRADPAHFNYLGAGGVRLRWWYLLRLLLAALLLIGLAQPAVAVALPESLLLLVRLVVLHELALSLVSALAYWAMREPSA
ncbi:hypothetical protein [Chitinilyticum piscinae]|uniref:Uncharacterized protein n=1 Tax=Chitinilyticum piscinae TaxID=2866724 RepID=A0A8J7K7N7_9NEIS|nr:hypothetical protein [Chitinilyticum piscinae]MBE9608353.1 hypothetical protein [Chitinilyticum piscinae]